MSTQWSGWPWVSTTAVRSSTAMCCWRRPNVPFPQSIQIAVEPDRKRYPLHAAFCEPPNEPEQPSTVSSTILPSIPLPCFDRFHLGPQEAGPERTKRVDRTTGQEYMTRSFVVLRRRRCPG